MSAGVFAGVVIVVLVAFAGGYVWGHLNGSASVPDPAQCRDKQLAAEVAAEVWQRRAIARENEVYALRAAAAEHERAETATVAWLLEQLDKATAPLALPAAAPAGQVA